MDDGTTAQSAPDSDPPPSYKVAKNSPKPRKSSTSADPTSPKHKKKPEKDSKRNSTDVKRSSFGKKTKDKDKRESREAGRKDSKKNEHPTGGKYVKHNDSAGGGSSSSTSVKHKRTSHGRAGKTDITCTFTSIVIWVVVTHVLSLHLVYYSTPLPCILLHYLVYYSTPLPCILLHYLVYYSAPLPCILLHLTSLCVDPTVSSLAAVPCPV